MGFVFPSIKKRRKNQGRKENDKVKKEPGHEMQSNFHIYHPAQHRPELRQDAKLRCEDNHGPGHRISM